jgi:ribosome-binding protein aMBF1 (putative translation factor)
MTTTSVNSITELEAKLAVFASNLRKADQTQFAAEMLHLDFMYLVKQRMNELNMSEKELAEKLGTSKGYLTQLFSGDKLVNLLLIARLQEVLGIRFEIVPKLGQAV